jgi:hypothetical protein
MIDINHVTSQDLRAGKYAKELPELESLKKITENSFWHAYQNVFDHVLLVFEKLQEILKLEDFDKKIKIKLAAYLKEKIETKTKSELVLIGSLLHDVAKSKTIVHEGEHFYAPGHELVGEWMVASFQKRFQLTTSETQYVQRIVKYHGLVSDVTTWVILGQKFNSSYDVFFQIVSDELPLLGLFMLADLRGSDLAKQRPVEFKRREDLLLKMIKTYFNTTFSKSEKP